MPMPIRPISLKVKAVDKPNEEETEALADVDQNKEAPKRGRGRPKKDQEGSGVKRAEEIENEDLAEDDQIKEVPKKGRGRPKKDQEESGVKKAEDFFENEDLPDCQIARRISDRIKEVPKKGRGRPKKDQGETEAGPPVKKAKKKVGGSKTVSKISIEFCKS